MSRRVLVRLLAACFGIGLATKVVAQQPDAATIARSLRETGHAGIAHHVLRQAVGRPTSRDLDAIADSLVAFVLSYQPDGQVPLAAAREATQALIISAQVEGPGVPYAGAPQRLLLVAEHASYPGLRASALLGLSVVPNRGAALGHLRSVATSNNPSAHVAIRVMAEKTGPEGMAALRQLHTQGLVTEPSARKELEAVARASGW